MAVDYGIIGRRIKQERKRSKLTQGELAERVNISLSFQSRMERGATKISLDMLSKLSAALDVPLSRFITDVTDSSVHFLDKELSVAIKDFTPNEKKLLLGIAKSIKQNRPK